MWASIEIARTASSLVDVPSVAVGEGGGLQQLQAVRGVIAVDLLDVELAHEGDGLGRDHLPRHHDGKAGGIRDHEVRRHELGTAPEPIVDLLAGELDELAV